jgi:hypothetical protein
MSFRFIFFGDNSQNDRLVDTYSQQAEANFRTTYQTEFSLFNPIVKPDSSISQPNSTNQSNVSGAVSELIQTISDKNKPVENAISAETSNLKIDNVKIAEPIDLPNPKEHEKSDEKPLAATADSQTINTVLQDVIAEKNITTEQTGIPTVTDERNSQMQDLINKMKEFVDSFKNTFKNFLEVLRQPQREFFYGADDVIKDRSEKKKVDLKQEVRQQFLEEKINRKSTELENNKQTYKKQVKLQEEQRKEAVEKQNKTDLEKIIAKKVHEERNKLLFQK